MITPHDRLLDVICRVSSNESLRFDNKGQIIEDFIHSLTTEEFLLLLSESGFIPEYYDHDSSEEKVYAKAMDLLVDFSFKKMGFESLVSKERSNAADVMVHTVNRSYSMVLDAKAFRVSRTALNPKDYKIEALNVWRKGADYACLVGPLVGFPEGKSRIFEESVKYNVTLLTFSHLQFMLERGFSDVEKLRSLWNISSVIQSPDSQAKQYWAVLDKIYCGILGVSMYEWIAVRNRYFTGMLSVADKQIQYFTDEKNRLNSMPRDELIKVAIRALKLDEKITVIEKKKRKAKTFLRSIEQTEI